MTGLAITTTTPKPKLPAGIIASTDISQEDRFKLFILGDTGSGKSNLVTTAPGPVLVLDFDGRAKSIAGKPDVYVRTFPIAVGSWNEVESLLNDLEYAKKNNNLFFKTIACDTVLYMSKLAELALISSDEKMRRGKKVGSRVYSIRNGFDSFNFTHTMVADVINRITALDVNVICTGHLRPEKAKDSTPDETKYTGKLTIDPQFLAVLFPTFSERWVMKVSGGKFYVQTRQTPSFNAITTLHIDAEEEADIQKILAKHRQNVAAGK